MKPRAVVREAVDNGRSAGLAAIAVMAISLVAASFLTGTTIRAADNAGDRQADLDAKGRYVLRIISQADGEPVPAGACAALNSIDGVFAAGGTSTLGTARLRTGQLVNVEAATDGYLRLVAGLAPAAGTQTVVGADLAASLGIRSDGFVQVVDGGPPYLRSHALATRALRATPRTGSIDDSLLVLQAPVGTVDECDVDPEPDRRDAVLQAAQRLARPGHPVVAQPFRDDVERDRTPERDLDPLPADPLSWAAGAIALIALCGWWYNRRQDWALYRTFGTSADGAALIAFVEWGAVCALPFVAGTRWATWACASLRPSWNSIALGWMNAGIALAVSALSVGLLRLALSQTDHTTTFRGR